jgi:hypothetical protein
MLNNIFCYYNGEGIFWFRVFNHGLCFNTTMTFSQRIGKSRYIKLGKWIVTYLKPN